MWSRSSVSPVWAIMIFSGVTPSSRKIRTCSVPVRLAGRECAMIGRPVRRLARAAARWTFSMSGVMPGLVGCGLQERGLHRGALDPDLDVVHEGVGEVVLVARLEVLRE